MPEPPAAPTLGYVICYVDRVGEALAFYGDAFGLRTRFVSEEGDEAYGELQTGQTVLAFASTALARKSTGEAAGRPAGFEVALVFADDDAVAAAIASAVSHGATEVAAPMQKPWGQTVAYVRDPQGVLIELCTPVAG